MASSGDKQLPEGTDAILDEDGFDAALEEPTELDADIAEFADEPEGAAETAEAGQSAGLDAPFEEDEAGGDTGAADAGTSTSDGNADEGPQDVRAAFFGKFDELRGQTTDQVFAFAQAGKDRATGAIDDVVRMVEDAASEIDAKIGTQYGDYARRAAQTIGGFSDAFKAKEVDDLFSDARDLVKKSPAVAIGAAAALGFVVARLVRASVPESGGDNPKAA
jgi:ElaB/YqjD/DUF883 family membrane-anchored ribosome-binding protein